MNKKVKNGSSSSPVSKKATSTKKMTKKDLEMVINSLEDKQLRLKAEFDNFRKRKESEISALFKYDGKNFIIDFLSILDNINRGIESYKDENTKKALGLIRQDFLKKMISQTIVTFGTLYIFFWGRCKSVLSKKADFFSFSPFYPRRRRRRRRRRRWLKTCSP